MKHLVRFTLKCVKCKKIANDEESYDYVYKPKVGWLCKKCKEKLRAN